MAEKIIDGHMHIAQWESANGESSFEILRKYQEANNIAYVDNMCCTSNGNLWQGFEADQSILGAIAKLENPTVFTHGCLYIPEAFEKIPDFDFCDQLYELMELGLDGIKICDFKPDAYKMLFVEKNLERYDDFISECEKNGVHMCWHVADPEEFWDPDKVSDMAKERGWFYGNGTYPSYKKLIDMTLDFIKSHPKLNVLLAHMFFKSFNPDEVKNLLDTYPHVMLDMAPGWEMFEGFKANYQSWYELFRSHSDRFMYATDMTMPSSLDFLNSSARRVLRFLETDDRDIEIPLERLTDGIRLEGCQLENVLYKNHERALGEKPREINKSALKKYIRRYLPLIPDSRNKSLTEEYYRKNLL